MQFLLHWFEWPPMYILDIQPQFLSNCIFLDAHGIYPTGCSRNPCQEWSSLSSLQNKYSCLICQVQLHSNPGSQQLSTYTLHLEHIPSDPRKLRWTTEDPRAGEGPRLWHKFPSPVLTDIDQTLLPNPFQHHAPGRHYQLDLSLKSHLHSHSNSRGSLSQYILELSAKRSVPSIAGVDI